MRVVIARMMPEPSMDVYADNIISGLRSVRPNWEIVDLKPQPVDRKSRSLLLRVWKYYERFWRFPQQVQQQVADIFHIIDPSEAHITYWLKKKNKAVVVTCHDLVNFYSHDNLQGSVELPFLSRGMWIHAVKGMKYADHVVAVSSATAKDTTQIMDIEPARISVIPNAVEAAFQPLPKEQAKSLRQKYGISPETVCLLNVGSNHPRKNLSTILKVIETLQQRGLSIHLWKVGADFTDEQKIFIKTQGLENHISYLGKPDKSTLIQIYNAADMLIAPSLHEGFGITLLEAMACGIPVITSKVSAMPEVVGEAGVLVDPNDYQAIADAVCHLHNHPDYYQELVNKGLARAKLFTWEKAGEQIAEIYEKVQACKEFKGIAKT
ncbi:MAG: glycosyltransferase family 4 protein [Brasilonema octagenarum HA4186-MV1]|jgi:glycosyltransferase involved in cell wall biosynthesis|nr:glycosyltransferase family 4 protein [Brasilonema octagenarum HA4186-MV1]